MSASVSGSAVGTLVLCQINYTEVSCVLCIETDSKPFLPEPSLEGLEQPCRNPSSSPKQVPLPL